MFVSRPSPFSIRLLALALSATFLPNPTHAATPDDVLARTEFNQELTLDMKSLSVAASFRVLSSLLGVPFLIDFEPEPSLTLTLKAENMVARGILSSMASSYDLEYSLSDEGIVVRRRGSPPARIKTTVGAWPLRAGALYLMEFQVRDAQGRLISSPKLKLRTGVDGTINQGGADTRSIFKFDRKRGLIEPKGIGGIQLSWVILREVEGTLDLAMEIVTTKAMTDDTYTEEHTVAQRRVPPTETMLFKTTTGIEIVLTKWSKISAAAMPPPRP